MKSLTAFLLFVVVRDVNSIPFDSRHNPPLRFEPRFGLWTLQRGGSKSNTVAIDATDDYERAEKAILRSVEKIEAIVEKAVANEVDVLFHKDHPEKEKITSKARKAVASGVDKVKSRIKGHSEKSLYPFETKSQPPQKNSVVHKDHRVLHAIEAAERAVLRAITNEVDTLFHETVHDNKSKSPNNPTVQQAKTSVKGGIMKAATVVDNVHSHRRDWLLNVSTSMIEDYSLPEFFLE
jgi:hypothetical protein